jgi:cell shape-determining protein MreC
MPKITAVTKRNILARLDTIQQNEQEIQDQRTKALLELMNMEHILEEMREEKHEMLKKLVKTI